LNMDTPPPSFIKPDDATREAKYPKNKILGRIAEIKSYHRSKSNSTSTLYVNSTPSVPDVDELLRCISITVQKHITDCLKPGDPNYEVFDEQMHPIYAELSDTTVVPTLEDVYAFVDAIFKAEKLSSECAVMMLAYIDRIVEQSGIVMVPSNWRRIMLSTLILASKVWEDQAVWNVDFLSVFPCVSVKDLGQLEKILLKLLQYNVSLKASVYTKYYFELRTLAEKDARNFPLEPLDKEAAKRLESRSQQTEESYRAENTKSSRTKSMSDVDPHSRSSPMILS